MVKAKFGIFLYLLRLSRISSNVFTSLKGGAKNGYFSARISSGGALSVASSAFPTAQSNARVGRVWTTLARPLSESACLPLSDDVAQHILISLGRAGCNNFFSITASFIFSQVVIVPRHYASWKMESGGQRRVAGKLLQRLAFVRIRVDDDKHWHL